MATNLMDTVEVIPIRTVTDIVIARQRGRALALTMRFSETEATLIATIISELARNIVLYAHQGEILMERLDNPLRPGISIVSRDEGPGIADVQRALLGGYSTSGGLGLGLCGVRRMVDEFQLQSAPGKGTTVAVKKWAR
ncbi:MAG: anti-sigma regulatory factor [Steroidobacteraceae bacterium]